MTVSGPHLDQRKPGLPYTLTVCYGATNSLVERRRYPSAAMAAAARRHLEEHGLDGSGWRTHVRPLALSELPPAPFARPGGVATRRSR